MEMTDYYDSDAPDSDASDAEPAQERGLVRQGFGSTEIVQHTETMSTAMAAAASAAIQARYIMAIKAPRDLMKARAEIMAQAERPTFAEAAIYRLPREKWDPETKKRVKVTIEGPTIRFAEALRLAWRNLVTEIAVVHEDAHSRVLLVTTTDLESNITETGPVTVRKTKEVQKIYKGAEVLAKRHNSEGQILYTVASSPADVDQATNSAIARVKRNQILALVPPNVKQDAIAACKLTMSNQTKQQLGAMGKQAQKAFADLGVPDSELTAYLGHPVTEATADEHQDLRGIYQSIREGKVTWAELYREAMEARRAEQQASIGLGGGKGGTTPPPPPPPAAPVDRELDEATEEAAIEAANAARSRGNEAAKAALERSGR